MAERDVTDISLFIVEYEQIKDEQRLRIGFRDNLIYVTLASMAAVVAATLQSHGHANLLLLLPPVTALLGWTYLANDEKITAIGRYIRHDLAPRVQSSSKGGEPVFLWESAHRDDRYRLWRKYTQLGVDLGTFSVPGVAALTVYWINGPWSAPFMAVSLIEVGVIAVLTAQMLMYADLVRGEGMVK